MELTIFLPLLRSEQLLPFPDDHFVGLDGDTLLLFDDSSESDTAPFLSVGSGRTSHAGFIIVINICCN